PLVRWWLPLSVTPPVRPLLSRDVSLSRCPGRLLPSGAHVPRHDPHDKLLQLAPTPTPSAAARPSSSAPASRLFLLPSFPGSARRTCRRPVPPASHHLRVAVVVVVVWPRRMGESPSPAPAPAAAAAKVYYEGCPGCAMERRKESSTGTPYKELFFVGITTFASSLPITSLFPFLYFMIQDLHVAQREEDIGFYAGFLGASYMVGRGFASIFWGMVADRIGRKPVIVFSLFTVIVFNTLFGLSVKYWMAITTRLLLGALNGFLAPIKVT
uniref:Major facilitator superfamily (MFS) profile domain-containing protein n=1 Tax=Aegilops tauschii subsp. strangulata TaxID=200361 RepID=A0A453KBW1_AEGTS